MAKIVNLEGNLKFQLNLRNVKEFDYDPQKSDYESWLSFVLSLELPNRYSSIEKDDRATMTIFEIKNLIWGIEKILEALKEKIHYFYEFNCSEAYFQLKFEVLPEDEVVEVELWLNAGSRTKGKICGFDEGVRFIINNKTLDDFLDDFVTEFRVIIKALN